MAEHREIKTDFGDLKLGKHEEWLFHATLATNKVPAWPIKTTYMIEEKYVSMYVAVPGDPLLWDRDPVFAWYDDYLRQKAVCFSLRCKFCNNLLT